METSPRGALWRVAIYVTVCLLFAATLIAVFSQYRYERATMYNAVFSNVSGLETGSFVRIGGVEVGKIKDVSVQPDSTVRVHFSADNSVILTEGTRAAIRYDDLIGGRFMALEEGAGGVTRLNADGTIPLAQTQPALDLDALIGGLRPVFRALSPDQVNSLTSSVIAALQGQGGTVSSILTQAASLTNTLADRDALIGDLVVSLNTVLGSLGDQDEKLGTTVDSLATLVESLEANKADISNSLAYTNEVSASIADLLSQARQPLKKVVTEGDRAAGIVVADKDYVDNLLATLPDTYRRLNRLALYGDFFTFYICDLVLKLNGKGGQPTYVKLAGQDSGRCAPK